MMTDLKPIIALALLLPWLADANTCFWQASMTGSGVDHKETLDFEQHFAGTEAFESEYVKKGFATQVGDVFLTSDDAALRTRFAVDPEARTLQVYGYSEIYKNQTQAETGTELVLRDYYQADGATPITVRVSYDFSDWYDQDDEGNAGVSVFVQAYNTDQIIYPISGSLGNLCERIFTKPDGDSLDYEKMLAYQSAHGEVTTAGISHIQHLVNFQYEFEVTPGTVVALDTLVGSFTLVGGGYQEDTGTAYAATKNGLRRVSQGQPPPPASDYHVRYNVEVVSGDGTFLPYSAPPALPPVELKPGLQQGTLSLIINSQVNTDYQIEVSTNLVDWTPWVTTNGNGSPLVFEIDTLQEKQHFYRIIDQPVK